VGNREQGTENKATLTDFLTSSLLRPLPTPQSQLPPPHLLFIVKDQGRGIPTNKLETIFEQFQQVDVSDSRQKGGTGLGLTICRKIVQEHGGKIWAESVLGEGSTFYFTLPIENLPIESMKADI
jgi:signal transduction histidine kinase